MPMVTKGSL